LWLSGQQRSSKIGVVEAGLGVVAKGQGNGQSNVVDKPARSTRRNGYHPGDDRRPTMRRIALLFITVALMLTPAGAAAGQSTAAAGLTVTARWALLSGPTAVVLVGQYSCGPFAGGVPDRGVIDMGVTQGAVRAIGYLTPTVCDGTQQWYAVELTTVGGATLRRAAATWSASGYVEGDTGMQNVSVPPTRIRIQ
jgi:hypothetical protein